MTSCSSAEMSTGALESPREAVWAIAEPPSRPPNGKRGPLKRLRAIAVGAIHRFINHVLMSIPDRLLLFRDRLARLSVQPCLDAAPEDDAVTLVIYGVGVGLHLSSWTFALKRRFTRGVAVAGIDHGLVRREAVAGAVIHPNIAEQLQLQGVLAIDAAVGGRARGGGAADAQGQGRSVQEHPLQVDFVAHRRAGGDHE